MKKGKRQKSVQFIVRGEPHFQEVGTVVLGDPAITEFIHVELGTGEVYRVESNNVRFVGWSWPDGGFGNGSLVVKFFQYFRNIKFWRILRIG